MVAAEVVIWSVKDGTPLVVNLSGYHTTRISTMVWSSGGLLATGGVDSTIFVWTPTSLSSQKPAAKTNLAHASGGINALAFVAEDKLASCGADACIKFWKV